MASRSRQHRNRNKDRWLKQKLKKDRKDPKCFVLDCIIFVAVLIMVLCLSTFLVELSDTRKDYAPSANSMEYDVMGEEYATLARYCLNYPEINERKNLKEYAAIGNYFLDALLMQSYKVNGDEEGMAFEQTKMQQCIEDMGAYTSSVPKINALLGIE